MKGKFTTAELTKMAILTALLCASAYISIPIGPSPITLQTLIVNLIAFMLTPFEAFFAILAYILLGFIGLPVFSGGVGGAGKLFGPTGGYILAFLVSAPLMSWIKNFAVKAVNRFGKKDSSANEVIAYGMTAVFVGMTIVYLLGTAYMKLSLGSSWAEALAVAVVPFIPLDLVKCAAAALIAVPLKRALAKMS